MLRSYDWTVPSNELENSVVGLENLTAVTYPWCSSANVDKQNPVILSQTLTFPFWVPTAITLWFGDIYEQTPSINLPLWLIIYVCDLHYHTINCPSYWMPKTIQYPSGLISRLVI